MTDANCLKTLIYLLIVLNIIVWGLVIFIDLAHPQTLEIIKIPQEIWIGK